MTFEPARHLKFDFQCTGEFKGHMLEFIVRAQGV